jgi:hypothetical protein
MNILSEGRDRTIGFYESNEQSHYGSFDYQKVRRDFAIDI